MEDEKKKYQTEYEKRVTNASKKKKRKWKKSLCAIIFVSALINDVFDREEMDALKELGRDRHHLAFLFHWVRCRVIDKIQKNFSLRN